MSNRPCSWYAADVTISCVSSLVTCDDSPDEFSEQFRNSAAAVRAHLCSSRRPAPAQWRCLLERMKKPHNSRSEEAFFSPKLPGQVDEKRNLGKSKDRKGLHGSRKLLPKLKGAGDACAESTSSLPGTSRSCGTGSRGFEEARPRPSPKAKSREGKEGKEGRQPSRDASAPATRSRPPKEPNQIAEKPPRRRLPPKPEAKPEAKAEGKAEAKADAKPRPEKPDSSEEARDQARNQASEAKKARPKPAQPASTASFSSALSGLGDDSEPERDGSMPASPKSVQGGTWTCKNIFSSLYCFW